MGVEAWPTSPIALDGQRSECPRSYWDKRIDGRCPWTCHACACSRYRAWNREADDPRIAIRVVNRTRAPLPPRCHGSRACEEILRARALSQRAIPLWWKAADITRDASGAVSPASQANGDRRVRTSSSPWFSDVGERCAADQIVEPRAGMCPCQCWPHEPHVRPRLEFLCREAVGRALRPSDEHALALVEYLEVVIRGRPSSAPTSAPALYDPRYRIGMRAAREITVRDAAEMLPLWSMA
jgi:hypothetical protein